MLHSISQLKFSKNPNGKLFTDVWGDIRLADYERYSAGSKLQVVVNKHEMGVVEVVGFKDFRLQKLTHCLSMFNCGQGVKHQKMLLHKYYDTREKEINDDTVFMFVTFKWVHRNMEEQEQLMEDWWADKKEQFPYISNH